MKTCPMCYQQIDDDASVCDGCGSSIITSAPSHSAGKRIACPWCLSVCNYEQLYTDGKVYRCPSCTKAFIRKHDKTQRSDGTSAAAKALALLLFAVFVLPLIVIGCG